ncbi:MAG: calcium-binding protein [Phenylobacterium sp.]|nr:calcium-binding protein [Phenylobacterium sp.]
MEFRGGAGGDFLNGRASDDLLYGFEGDDTLMGRGGDDVLAGHQGDDSLSGGAGDDYLLGGLGDDTIHGGSGVDWAAYEDATGAVSVDLRVSGAQHTGGAGVDKLIAIENLYGSAFNDHLFGDDAKNFLSGGAGADTIYGHGGDDHLEGGLGNDHLDGGEGYDVVSYDGDFAVTVSLRHGHAHIEGPNGGSLYKHTLVSIEDVYGSNLDDHIYGNVETNYLFGRGGADYISSGDGGDDFIDGGSGDDFISLHLAGGHQIVDGGEGSDEISFAPAPGSQQAAAGGPGVRIDLSATGVQEISENVFVSISSIEKVTGTAGNDTITGSAGVDTLTGGGGNDRFVFGAGDTSSTTGSVDRINDFTSADDSISFGVAATASNYVEFGYATLTYTYAQAFSDASSLINGGQRDIIAVQVGADVYVFADVSGTNMVTGVVYLSGVTLAGVEQADFVA